MRSTSAPCAARVRPQIGPAMTRVRSATRTPESGRSPAGSRTRRGVADPFELDDRDGGERRGLRMSPPFLAGALCIARQPVRRQIFFHGERVLARERTRNRVFVVGAAEHLQNPLAVMRIGHVKLHPTPRRVAEVRLRAVRSFDRRAVDPQVSLAAVGDGGVTHRDPNRLDGAGAQPPQLARRESGRPDAGVRRGADREHRRERGLVAGELDAIERFAVALGEGPEPLERGARGHHTCSSGGAMWYRKPSRSASRSSHASR